MARFFPLILVATLALSATAQQQQGPNQSTNYNTGDSGRSETVNPDGSVQGQYSYTDPNGKVITVKYSAGKDGFKVEGDHLPKAPLPVAPVHPQQQPQQQYNNPQPQYNNNYQQPQQYNNNYQQPQQQYNNGNNNPSNFLQGFGPQNGAQQQYNNYQHPNALPQQQQQQYSPFQNQQQSSQGQQNNGGRGGRVSVSQQPEGFSYTYQS